MKTFTTNGYLWRIIIVNPGSTQLVDRTGKLTLATTDPTDLVIYISGRLKGEKFMTVLIHELGHAALYSYGLLGDIHRMVRPEYWIEAEEWVCNLIADYGWVIFRTAYSIMGANAWMSIPYELDRIA